MKRTQILTAVLAAGFAATTLVGCGGGDGDTTEIANPASQYCIDQGGTLEIVSEEGGEVGYCNLPDGTRIEEWEFFRANN
jgi:putative hemolysin